MDGREEQGSQAARAGAGSQRGPTRGFHLFDIAGIAIRIDYSWFLIFLLVLWSLSAGYFPHVLPEQGTTAYWAAGLAATLLFFLSILAHELAHSFVAMRAGLGIEAITLFVFGGVSHMEDEPETPGTELRIAIAGPLMSFALAALFFGAWTVLPGSGGAEEATLASTVLRYLALINAALGVFNLLPGFPLDGGRVFRALAWWRTGSLRRGTRLAADIGKGLAVGIMVLGGFQIFAGALLGGLWLIFIGMFLRGMADASYQSLIVKRALENLKVRRVMSSDPVTVEPEMPVRELIDEYFLRTGHRGFPVVEDGEVFGIVTLAEAKAVPEDQRSSTQVRDVMKPAEAGLRIAPDAALQDALRQMQESDADRLVVMRGSELVGILSRTGVARFLELQELLSPEEE